MPSNQKRLPTPLFPTPLFPPGCLGEDAARRETERAGISSCRAIRKDSRPLCFLDPFVSSFVSSQFFSEL